METRETIAIVGAGLIGQAWAIVFARAGRSVLLTDADPEALARCRDRIGGKLAELRRADLIDDTDAVLDRIATEESLAGAVAGASYVQECGPEKVEVKRALFSELEGLTEPDTILASSTSGIVASQFADGMRDPGRVLVAHPVNPPSLVPLVEIAPAPQTADAVVTRTIQLMEEVGQSPVLVRREIEGFILNRLQGALLNEALRLFGSGHASAEDIDRAVRDGLGRRWAFMGPFETIDLNAPGGAGDYAERYGPLYSRVDEARDGTAWEPDTVARLVEELRAARPADTLQQRQDWRDTRMMALASHLRAQSSD